jgi:outer membrane protein OmpA-like peptidoglycan-associated protein
MSGRAWAVGLAIVAAGCASSRRAPEQAPPVATPVATPPAEAGEAEPVEPRGEVVRLKSLLEREAELAAEQAECDREREQEQARRWFGCHPERGARLRFAVGSAELDAAGRAAVDRLVRRLQGEPGASMIVLGGQRDDEGEELAGIDRRRAMAVRDALLARGVPERQIIAAAEFRSPVRRSWEVDVLWVCEVCCIL